MEKGSTDTVLLRPNEKTILTFLEKSKKPMRTREIMHGVENLNYAIIIHYCRSLVEKGLIIRCAKGVYRATTWGGGENLPSSGGPGKTVETTANAAEERETKENASKTKS